MRYKLLGRTGLYVSQICLGTMTFGGKGFWEVTGKVPASEAEAFIRRAFLNPDEALINTITLFSLDINVRKIPCAAKGPAFMETEFCRFGKISGRQGV